MTPTHLKILCLELGAIKSLMRVCKYYTYIKKYFLPSFYFVILKTIFEIFFVNVLSLVKYTSIWRSEL